MTFEDKILDLHKRNCDMPEFRDFLEKFHKYSGTILGPMFLKAELDQIRKEWDEIEKRFQPVYGHPIAPNEVYVSPKTIDDLRKLIK